MEIPLTKVRDCPWNTRVDWEIEPLSADMSAKGQLQNVLVRPIQEDGERVYQVVFGARRVRAALLAKMKTIWAMVQDLSDDEAMLATYRENELRKRLSSPEREALVLEMWESGRWDTYKDLANALGVSSSTIGKLVDAAKDRKTLRFKSIVASDEAITTTELAETRGLDEETRVKVLEKVVEGKLPTASRPRSGLREYTDVIKKAPEPLKEAILEDEVDFADAAPLVDVGVPEDMVEDTVQELRDRKMKRDEVTRELQEISRMETEGDVAVLKGDLESKGFVTEISKDEKRYRRFESVALAVQSWRPFMFRKITTEKFRQMAIDAVKEIRNAAEALLAEMGERS